MAVGDVGFGAGTKIGGGGSGSNQFFPFMPSMPVPGNTPGGGAGAPGFPSLAPPVSAPPTQPLQFTGPPGASGMTGIGKGLFAQNPLDPALTSQFFQWLQSQIGQGVPGFNQSATLPSSGAMTSPGQLNAPLNEVMKNLMSIFDPQSGSLGKLATGGIDATPIWQKTVDALERKKQEGAANLREQFNFAGNLDSSPFGRSMVDYETQSNKDIDALLANMQFQGIQDQMAAAGMQGELGGFLQGLDQQSIQNMLQEFIRTSPQYNPLLGMLFGAGTTFPPVINPKQGAGSSGSLLAGAGGFLSGLADIFGLF